MGLEGAVAPVAATAVKEMGPSIAGGAAEVAANVNITAPSLEAVADIGAGAQVADALESQAASGDIHGAIESMSTGYEDGSVPGAAKDLSGAEKVDNLGQGVTGELAEAGGAQDGTGGSVGEKQDVPRESDEGVASDTENAGQTKNDTSSPEDSKPSANSSEEDKAKMEELQKMRDSGDKMTGEQLQELRDLENNDPERQFQSLDEKYKNGDPMTKEEFDKYAEMRNEKNTKDAEESENPEDPLDKEIEDLGTDLMSKMANGEYESVEKMQEDAKDLQDKMAEKSLQEKGFTKEQSKAAVEAANKRNSEQTETSKKRNSEIQDKIQELMIIEYQIMTVPPQVEEALKKREQAVARARVLHSEAQSKTDGTIERVQAKAKEANQYMVIENLNQYVSDKVHFADRLNERRRDIEQQVRSKLGVTGTWGALMEWGANRAINTVTELRIKAQDAVTTY